MRKLLITLFLIGFAPLALALSPYYYGDKVPAGEIPAVLAQVEAKLVKAGFQVVGKHTPPGLPGHGVIVVTDEGLLSVVRKMGGANIVGAPIRIGVKADGTVSYMNLDYWERAFFRKQYSYAQRTVRAAQAKLVKALGAGKPFGGSVDKIDLADYQYMFGMEGFDSDKNVVMEHLSFDDAVKTIQDNLTRGVGRTSKVYEIIMPDKKLAVFGVALNDPKEGEGWWVKSASAENIAALPYEIYVVNNKAGHLFARFRIALGWPNVGMGTFMRIVEAPGVIRDTLTEVAGGSP
ncbi:MAG: hypothetical protein Q8M09_02705 [Pseudomonadota bacterium]|nr:hypothetical protein [Pseudomonadota bacterium]MDP1572991.1 hypothetical protein [Pseudomonadota bacterium]MDP1903149.1 hypothetical protein [Pseudomonadota bacterium]